MVQLVVGVVYVLVDRSEETIPAPSAVAVDARCGGGGEFVSK
jgi:hypothetical protein